MQLDDAESAQQDVPAPAPTAATGGTNNDDVNDVEPEPPAAGVEQPPMGVDDEAVNQTATPDHRRSTNSFVRQTYERFIRHPDPEDLNNHINTGEAGYRILATFRGESHVYKSYDEMITHNTILIHDCPAILCTLYSTR